MWFEDKKYDLKLSSLLQLDENNFRKTFSRSPIKRIGRDRFIRNCCIAAGNSNNKKLLKQLEKLINDTKNAVVIREAASWAIKELEKDS